MPQLGLSAAEIQDQLLKAMGTGDVASLIKEDLEVEAHNQLYEDASTTELTLLKNIARKPATNILHQYDIIKSYGNERTSAYMPEDGLPTRSKSVYERKTANIKIFAEWAAVLGIAALQTPIRARGSNDLNTQEQKNKRSLLMHKENRELYFADSSLTRSTLTIDGVLAILGQYTSTTTGHFIDMGGHPLRNTDIRNAAELVSTYFGAIRQLYMSPKDRSNLEANLDTAERLLMQPNLANQQQMYLGQMVDGMVTGGSKIRFMTDNILTPRHANATAPDNTDSTQFPDGVPDAVTLTAAVTDNGGAASKWVSTLTDWTFRVTAKNDIGESTYAETSAFTGTALHSYTISWTGRVDDNEYCVYLGSPTAVSTTAATSGTGGVWYLVKRIKAAGSTAAQTYTETGAIIPNTRVVLGLNINTEFAANGVMPIIGNPALVGNTLSFVELAPLFTFELANLLFNSLNELLIHPALLEITHPWQNVVFINVGDIPWT